MERKVNVLFNDALNTFYLWLYGVKDYSDSQRGYLLPPHGLTARVLLYAPSHRQDSTYHGLCYTSRGALAGTRNSSMGPPHEGSIRRPIALTTELHLAPVWYCVILYIETSGSINCSFKSTKNMDFGAIIKILQKLLNKYLNKINILFVEGVKEGTNMCGFFYEYDKQFE